MLIPRPLACRRCGHEVAAHAVAPEGVIEAYTTIHVASAGFDTPYVIAYARLDAGPRLLVRLTGTGAEIERLARVVVRPAEPGALPTAEPMVTDES